MSYQQHNNDQRQIVPSRISSMTPLSPSSTTQTMHCFVGVTSVSVHVLHGKCPQGFISIRTSVSEDHETRLPAQRGRTMQQRVVRQMLLARWAYWWSLALAECLRLRCWRLSTLRRRRGFCGLGRDSTRCPVEGPLHRYQPFVSGLIVGFTDYSVRCVTDPSLLSPRQPSSSWP